MTTYSDYSDNGYIQDNMLDKLLRDPPNWVAQIEKTRFGYAARFNTSNSLIGMPYYRPFRFTRRGIENKARRVLRKLSKVNESWTITLEDSDGRV